MKTITLNKKRKTWAFSFALCSLLFVLFSCDLGQLGGADRTDTYYPADALFEERLQFLCGVWYSYYAGVGRLDGYRIRKWSDFDNTDKAKAQALFSGLNASSLRTCSSNKSPQNNDYILLYDDTVYGQEDDGTGGNESWGFSYMGLVRAINIFNSDIKRGAVIIEYFEKADPEWLSDPDGYVNQGLAPGEKPFFGIYFKVSNSNTVQMANPVDLAALDAKKPYYTEQGTLNEAVKKFDVENEAEFINWGVTYPQIRE